MTSYDHDEHFGLYLVLLSKSAASPLLPESDEDPGVNAPPTGTDNKSPENTEEKPRQPKTPVNVNIDFEGLGQRILAVPGIPVREYSALRAGAAGTVFYLEARTGGEGPGIPPGNTLNRYRLSDRKAIPFMAGVADYNVSADGRKLAYRQAIPTPDPANAPANLPPPVPALFLVDADKPAGP